jgi:glycosyltransferase involved in cell wall biosynthesis
MVASLDFKWSDSVRVLAFTRYGRLGASSRIRTYQYVPALKTLGIDVQVSPLLRDSYIERLYEKQGANWFSVLSDYLKQAIQLFNARKFDLIWIEKELFPNLPPWFEQILNARGVRYIVDYDDAIFHNYDLSPHPAKQLLAKKIDKVMRNSTLVVCGNAYLADRAQSANAHYVEIIPTVIDLERYEVLQPPVRDHVIVGWIGSPSTVKYLDMVVPALEALTSEFPLKLRVIGAKFASSGLAIDCRPWSEASEVKEIQDFDIGIMPLRDSPWERGKCGYKLIQYMACGKPVVASPVGVNQELVRPEVNGYLAWTVDDWINAFRALVSNSQRRVLMGAQGRSSVEKSYSLQVTAPRMAQVFEEALSRGVR